jgi:hypothetical protein
MEDFFNNFGNKSRSNSDELKKIFHSKSSERLQKEEKVLEKALETSLSLSHLKLKKPNYAAWNKALAEIKSNTTRKQKVKELSPNTIKREQENYKKMRIALKNGTKSNPLRLHVAKSNRLGGISAGIDIENTGQFQIGRTLHNCSQLINNCANITQTSNRGAYTIIYNNGAEHVFGSFEKLVTYILNAYMRAHPRQNRQAEESRIINTLIENGIAKGKQTKKRRGRRTGTQKGRRNGRKHGRNA